MNGATARIKVKAIRRDCPTAWRSNFSEVVVIQFKCPHCAKAFRVDDSLAGKHAKCSGCGQRIEVPAPPLDFLPADSSAPSSAATVPFIPTAVSTEETRPCPYCGEPILCVAKKCKHCGEFLDGRPETGSTLVNCPACDKQVSSKAPSCPHCGNPIGMKAGPFGGLEKGTTVRPDFWHDPNVGCIGSVIFLVLLWFFLMAQCRH